MAKSFDWLLPEEANQFLCSGSASWIFPFAKQKVLIQPNALTFIYQKEILGYK